MQPTDQNLRFTLVTTRQPDGALSGLEPDAAAAPLWLPTSRWQPGQLIRLEMSLRQVRGLQAAGVAVEDQAGHRIPAQGSVPLWDNGTIAQVVRLS